MTKDEARKWIEERVIWGLLDTRTLTAPCKELVLYFQKNPADQPILIEALSDFLTNQKLKTYEQVENVAYLVVNFGNRRLLDGLFSKLTGGDFDRLNPAEKPDGFDELNPAEFNVQIAMAAIRSFPSFDANRDDTESRRKSDFLPFLMDCLREKNHASLAYEILSQFYPKDMVSYFLWALAHHSSDLTLVEDMLADLYFDQREEAPGALALEVIRDILRQLNSAVEEHPLIPKDAKSQLVMTEPIESVKPPKFNLLDKPAIESCRETKR
jgi:hypothetical protein